jgi:hypothetical protein
VLRRRLNMTAPKSNFCSATDLALISEPATSGGGIIGIVSYNSPDSRDRANAIVVGD